MATLAQPSFRAASAALIRAAAGPPAVAPPWPVPPGALDEQGVWVTWLSSVWADPQLAEAIGHASQALASTVRDICAGGGDTRKARRAALATGRYMLRIGGRATPFGLMAGVAGVSFSQSPRVRLGGGSRVVARAGAEWLAEIIAQLEQQLLLLERLSVTASSALMFRGDRLIVPYRPGAGSCGTAAFDVSIRCNDVVRAAVEQTRVPVRVGDLAGKLHAACPGPSRAEITGMLASLVGSGALITCLHAPYTEPDGLSYLIRQLDEAGADSVERADELTEAVKQVGAQLRRHNLAASPTARAVRLEAADSMRDLARTRQHPIALDTRLDADIVLPIQVAREAERAGLLLTRLSAYPAGTATWRAYHQRFYERYGLGALVPLLDVISDSGIGWPDGYPGSAAAAPHSAASTRDQALLDLAARAALDGATEVSLGEQEIAGIELGSRSLRLPPHLELGFRLYAQSQQALGRGEFQLLVTTVSRAAGVLTGRFLHILPDEARGAMIRVLSGLPGSDLCTETAQLSFPPLNPATGHVARTPQVLPLIVSLAEHRSQHAGVLTPADLTVGCDGTRMFLAAPERGIRVEAAAMHALNLNVHTPPLARFITELSRAQYAQVTVFDWGAAARLPFLPRLKAGRTILSAARWRLRPCDLAGRTASPGSWDATLAAWRDRLHVPALVELTEADQQLPLDLDQAMDRALLRAHLDKCRDAVLTETPDVQARAWCGSRPHEIIIPLTAAQPPPWPPVPAPAAARIIRRGHGLAPGASRTLLASLYGDIRRQDTVLAGYLPDLLGRLGDPPWWYIRYRDPAHHLRLRITLPSPERFGTTAQAISTWTAELTEAGLLSEVSYPTSYPETGRWGAGAAWDAAEAVFRADSAAILTQLSQPSRPEQHALAAAGTVAIAIAFTGSVTSGMQWLVRHVPAVAPERIPRSVFTEAARIADPGGCWAALRGSPGGEEIAASWPARDQALAAYRASLEGPERAGISTDGVLDSLIHVSFVRSRGIDFAGEAVVMYLARSAALGWTARTSGTAS
jgi:lantibiotic biosynthesis protein